MIKMMILYMVGVVEINCCGHDVNVLSIVTGGGVVGGVGGVGVGVVVVVVVVVELSCSSSSSSSSN